MDQTDVGGAVTTCVMFVCALGFMLWFTIFEYRRARRGFAALGAILSLLFAAILVAMIVSAGADAISVLEWGGAVGLFIAALIFMPRFRVRCLLALSWTLAIVMVPAMIVATEDDAKQRRYVSAAADVASSFVMLDWWLGWRERLKARKRALIAAKRHQGTRPESK
ncbi:MAG: hypothetical protein ACREQC_15410, partial [Candidatus Binataceae bacterium]